MGEIRGWSTIGPCAQGSTEKPQKPLVLVMSLLQGCNYGDKCQGPMRWVEQAPLLSPSPS